MLVSYYCTQHTAGAYGLVVDVAVTGVKKTVTIRSALQVRTISDMYGISVECLPQFSEIEY